MNVVKQLEMLKSKVAIPLIAASKLIPDVRLRLRIGSRIVNPKMSRQTIVKTNCIQNSFHPNDGSKI
jgi:hypothetical protein